MDTEVKDGPAISWTVATMTGIGDAFTAIHWPITFKTQRMSTKVNVIATQNILIKNDAVPNQLASSLAFNGAPPFQLRLRQLLMLVLQELIQLPLLKPTDHPHIAA